MDEYKKKGEDIKAGRKVFSKGHYFREQDIGMLASLGLKKVNVIRKLRVGILSNGNELVEPGKKNYLIKFMIVIDICYILS